MPERLFVDNPVGMRELLYSPTGPVGHYLVRIGEVVKAEAMDKVGVYHQPPQDTRARARRPGTLRDSITTRFTIGATGPEIEVGSTDDIALIHHEGTEAHVITARNAPMLVFYWPKAGGWIFTRQVHHPGTKPNHYLSDPMEQVVTVGLFVGFH